MLEIFFVIGFFIMLLSTRISVLSIVLALMAGLLLMLFAAIFVIVAHLFSWLLLALTAAWIFHKIKKSSVLRL